VWRNVAVSSWNEITFSRSELPRVEILTRLEELFAAYELKLGHRYRCLTEGIGVAADSLRAMSSMAAGWTGMSFDLTWPHGAEADVRLWRDDSGHHHLAIGEISGTFTARADAAQLERFINFCTEVCEALEMRYAVYDREPLSHAEKLAPASRVRAQEILTRRCLTGKGGILIVPVEELGELDLGDAPPPHLRARTRTRSGLGRLIFVAG